MEPKNMKECYKQKSPINSKLHMIYMSSNNVRQPVTKNLTALHWTTVYFLAFKFRPTTLHYTSLHFTTSHYTSLHFTTLHYTSPHYTTPDYTSLHFTTPHYTSLHFTTLHYTSLHFTTLHYTSLHFTTLHYTSLHFTTLYYTSLHFILFNSSGQKRKGTFDIPTGDLISG